MFATQRFQNRPAFEVSRQTEAAAIARRSNRRRLLVFLAVFLLTLLPGLAWNLLRPGEFRAEARIQITPGAVSQRGETSVQGASTVDQPGQRIDLLTQVQILNSRSLLEEVNRRLGSEGLASAPPGVDPIAELQNAIGVTLLSGTDVVEVQALGMRS